MGKVCDINVSHMHACTSNNTNLMYIAKQDYGGPLDNPTYVTGNELEQHRKLDNPLYDTHHGPQGDSRSSTATYENISDIQVRSSLQDQDPATGAKKLPFSQYSVITRRDSDISSSHTYSDVDEEEREQPVLVESQYSLVTHVRDGTPTSTIQVPVESQYSVVTHDNEQQIPIESGYSVITQSNFGHDIDEASDSETEGEDESRKSLL